MSRKFNSKDPEYSEMPFTIVLIVHNASQEISKKLDWIHSLSLKGLEKVLIIDDGSTDDTSKILSTYNNKLLETVSLSRGGKSRAINVAREKVTTPLAVFMDVRQSIDEDSLQRLKNQVVENYEACSGHLHLTSGSKHYWSYESRIRFNEGLCGATIGLSGCAFAIRCSHWVMIPDDCLVDDLALGLGVLSRGGKVAFDPKVVVKDPIVPNWIVEFKRKLRTLSGNWQIFFQHRRYFLPSKFKENFFLINHKLFRLFLPGLFAFVFIGFFEFSIILFLLFLFLVILEQVRGSKFLTEFFLLNIASLCSFFCWKFYASRGYWDPQELKSK